jgi:hypothetical protein
MKSQIVRTVVAFAGGAACASVIAGSYYAKPIGPAEFQDRMSFVVQEISDLGGQVVISGKGLVWLTTKSVDACMLPPPKPNVVDPRNFSVGLGAAQEWVSAMQAGNPEPIRLTDKCHPMDPD